MMPTKPLILAATVLLTACISLPDIEVPEGTPDSGTPGPDSGTPPSLMLTLVAPSGATYTNGAVSVQLQVQGDTPDKVELLVDEQLLTTLTAPYTFTWDTAALAEGTHRLAARAKIGDKTFPSEVREVVVDRTPPQVVSRTPTPGAQDVWVRQPIQATFSEPLKPSTLTSASVKLTVGGTEMGAAPSLSTDGKTLTVIPASRPTALNSVDLTLSPAVTDLAGNALSLATGTWVWSYPVSLSLGNLSAVGDVSGRPTPAVVTGLHLGSNGQPYVIWIEDISGTSSYYNTYVQHWTGSSWEPVGDALDPEPARRGYDSSNMSQILQTDSSGTPIAAWIHHDTTYSNIHVSRWFSNQWRPIGLPLGAMSSPRALSFRLDKSDTPILAWVSVEPDNSIHVSVVKWSGQDWVYLGTPLLMYGINSASKDAYPSLTIDRSGAPVIAWPNYGNIGFEPFGIQVSRWSGSQWESLGPPVTAHPPAYAHFPRAPDLTLDASGRLMLAWSESNGSTFDVHVHRWNESLLEWEPVGSSLSGSPGVSEMGRPKLSMDGAGNVFVMWEERNPSQGSYEQHFRRWSGSAWETIGAPISSPKFLYPSFEADASGNLFSAWASDDVLIHRYNY